MAFISDVDMLHESYYRIMYANDKNQAENCHTIAL